MLNLFLLIFLFLIIAPFCTLPASHLIHLPKAVTSDAVSENLTLLTLTGEDIITLDNKVLSLKELKNFLDSGTFKNRPILIKADQRSSLTRVIEILNICRQAGYDKVGLATTVTK